MRETLPRPGFQDRTAISLVGTAPGALARTLRQTRLPSRAGMPGGAYAAGRADCWYPRSTTHRPSQGHSDEAFSRPGIRHFRPALAAMRPAAAEGCPDGYTMAALGTAQCIPIPGLYQVPGGAWQPQQPAPRPSAGRSVGGDRLRSVSGKTGVAGSQASRRQAERCRGDLPAEGRRWKSPTPINAASSSGAITGRSPSSRPRWNKPRSWRSISATATAAAPARSFLGLQHARAGAIGRGGGAALRPGRRHLIQAQFDQVQQGPYTRAGRMPMAVHGQQLQGGRNSSGTSTSRPAARSSWQGPAARIAYPIPWRAPPAPARRC